MRPINLKQTLRTAALTGAAAILALSTEAPFAGEGSEEEYARDEPDNPNDARFHFSVDQWRLVTGYWISPEGTASVTDAIAGSYEFCDRLEQEEYQVDCLAEQLLAIANAMPETGDYEEARKILKDAATETRRLVQANADTAKPRVRASGTVRGKQIRTKPLTAVRPQSVQSVKRKAADILEEAETKLLRSAQASDRRLIAYAQMARAVGSNKTLLRSA